jgi:hypothetical protein
MQLLKSSLYLFQFFADTNLIDHTCILTCTNTTCIVDKTVYVTWHLVSSWIWWNCMVNKNWNKYKELLSSCIGCGHG